MRPMLSVSPCCHNNPKLVCKCLYVTLYWSVTCSQYFRSWWSVGCLQFLKVTLATFRRRLHLSMRRSVVNGLWEAVVTSGDAPWLVFVKSPLQKKLLSGAVQRTVFCGFVVIGGLQLQWGRVEVAASCSRCKHIHTHTGHSKYRDCRHTHSN